MYFTLYGYHIDLMKVSIIRTIIFVRTVEDEEKEFFQTEITFDGCLKPAIELDLEVNDLSKTTIKELTKKFKDSTAIIEDEML